MTATDLSQRTIVPEKMDDPAIEPRRHRQALRGLARLNRLSAAERVLWPLVRSYYERKFDGKRMRVLDLACGAGDVTCRLAVHAEHAGLKIDFQGCDFAQTAVDMSRLLAEKMHSSAVFFRHDVLEEGMPGEYDLVLISLFVHHLSNETAVRLLRDVSDNTPACIISDLERSQANLMAVRAASFLVTRSPVVHFDGPASVRAAFTESELREILSDAGQNQVDASRRFPCRLLMSWGLR